MSAPRLLRPRRPNMRRAVILFPSGLTLSNLFFGVFAIIAAARGDFRQAGVYVLLGGICDVLDGQVARATNAGTQFGEELDSLVDAITFGFAPGMIMYFAVLNRDGWDWIFVFLFAACAVMRLARFNIEQAGTAKTYFQGLPSPAAGITLASYYWFSQSWLYTYGAIDNLPWHVLLRYLMAILAALMISNIPYPVFPRAGFRSLRAIGASLLIVGSLTLLATKKFEYFFPLTLIYIAVGPIRFLLSGLFERRQPTIPYDLSEGEDDDEDEEFELGSSQVHAYRQAEREKRPARDSQPKLPRDDAPPAAKGRLEERPLRTPRPDRTDRTDRAPSTDAERADRAARREKRDKRDKREKRPPRAERSPRPPEPEEGDALAAAPTGVDAISVGELLVADTDVEVIGRIPGAADAPGMSPLTEGAPARKRKRRRRRGERKERTGGDAASGPSDDSSDDAESGPDAPDESESRSPYSVAAPPAFAPPPSQVTPPPLPRELPGPPTDNPE